MNFRIQKLFSTSLGKPVYIVAGKRTPIGTLLGGLSKKKATDLGSISLKGAIDSISLPTNQIDEVIMGNVISSGLGQNPTKQVSLGAGIPVNVPTTTINKVCASGLKALAFGALGIGSGLNHCVAAGGYESMSNVPFYVPNVLASELVSNWS